MRLGGSGERDHRTSRSEGKSVVSFAAQFVTHSFSRQSHKYNLPISLLLCLSAKYNELLASK